MQAPGDGLTWRARAWRPAVAIAGAALASLAAGDVMVLTRLALGVRTLPERLMDLMLLVIPPSLFEATLLAFGFDAKRYALALTVAAMMIGLTLAGGWVVARGWSIARLALLSLAIWLLEMLVLMPLSGAGLFAIALIDGTKAAIGAHLAVALTYVAGLVATRAYLARPGPFAGSWSGERTPVGADGADAMPAILAATYSRRSALALAGAALASLAATFAAARWGPKLRADAVIVPEPGHPGASEAVPLPRALPTPASSGAVGATQPTAVAPRPVAGPTQAPTAGTAARQSTPVQPPTLQPVQPHPSAVLTPPRAVTFEPPPVRNLSRDKDGVVLSTGRQPGQLADSITATDAFYVVSKNPIGDPVLDVADWRLHVDGDVVRPIEIDYRSLRNLPPVEVVKTLECISNFVTKCELAPFGCELISTASWKGARLRDIVALAGGLAPGVSALAAVAADEFTTTLPIEVALDPDTLMVYEMNGQTLAREHGYPARVLVPGRYGMKSAKWVVVLRPLRLDPGDWYSHRGWSKDAVIKTMTRIDTPGRNADLPPGSHRIAGIAYAGNRGIQRVELSADGGDRWHPAEILDRPSGRDVWIRWEGAFDIPPNTTLTLMSRAIDGTGELQTESFSLPQPDGSTGWHLIEVRSTSG